MFSFFQNCVSWDSNDVHNPGGLSDLIDGRQQIARRSFLQHVDRAELQRIALELGYCAHPSQGLTMAGDWHIEYFKSALHGQTVYGFRYSGIEYVFTAAACC